MRKIDEPARGGTKHLPVASGGISRLAYRRAQAEGINLDAQLKMPGFTRAQIKVRDQIKFLNFVASALNDDFLGFRLAQSCDLREIGLLYYVLASSETLIDALQRAGTEPLNCMKRSPASASWIARSSIA